GQRDDAEGAGAQVLDVLARPDRLTRGRVESDQSVGRAHYHRAEWRKAHEGDVLTRGELPKHRVRGPRRGALGSQRRTDRQGQLGKKCVPPEHEVTSQTEGSSLPPTKCALCGRTPARR